MKFTSLIAFAAFCVPAALANDLTLYFSTHDAEYRGSFNGAIDVTDTKLNDASGKVLRVLGADKFTSVGQTMWIALSLDQSHTVWCTAVLNKELSPASANLILSDGSAPGTVKSVLRTAVSSGQAQTLDASAITFTCN